MTDEQKQPLNGIRVIRERGRVGVAVGDGKQILTASLDPVAARRIGMSILNAAIMVGRARVEGEGDDAG